MRKHHIVGWRLCEEGVEREAEGKKVQKEGVVSCFLGFNGQGNSWPLAASFPLYDGAKILRSSL